VPGDQAVDLVSLDGSGSVYSLGRFGFSVQATPCCAAGPAGRWPLLWPKLGWKTGGTWTPLSLRVHLVAAGP